MDKKELRAQVETKITSALADFTKDLSDKKFKKHIKKAAKILSDGLVVSSSKKPAPAPAEPSKPKAVAKKAPAKKAAKAVAKSKVK